MSAIYPRVNHEPINLRATVDGTGNDLDVPYSTVIASSEYSESIGFGGLVIDLELRNVDENASAADGEVLIETSTDRTFAATPIVTEEYGTVPFESVPVNQTVMVRNVEGGSNHIRINNTSDVDISVKVWYTPNRV